MGFFVWFFYLGGVWGGGGVSPISSVFLDVKAKGKKEKCFGNN